MKFARTTPPMIELICKPCQRLIQELGQHHECERCVKRTISAWEAFAVRWFGLVSLRSLALTAWTWNDRYFLQLPVPAPDVVRPASFGRRAS